VTLACPNGHASGTSDYCDQCGAPIAAARQQADAVLPALEDEDKDTSRASPQVPCPACGAPRSGDDRFCENCGHDFLAPPVAAAAWEAVVSADRAQYERFAIAGVSFPADYSERRFPLQASEVRIGRSRGRPDDPELQIDLGGPIEDPGISRLHAALERQKDGRWRVRDLGSTNGTTLNDDPTPVGTDTPVSLEDGDRIRLGAWTTITLRAR
jgi:hypothetical protein